MFPSYNISNLSSKSTMSLSSLVLTFAEVGGLYVLGLDSVMSLLVLTFAEVSGLYVLGADSTISVTKETVSVAISFAVS